MTENNGAEPAKFQFTTDEEDDQPRLALPKVIIAGPDHWVDGMTFVLRRRGGNRWRLILESSPATIVDSRPLGGALERD